MLSKITNIKNTFFLFGFLFIINYSTAQTSNVKKDKQDLKLLIIGNSFSYNATKYLPQLAAEGGHKLIIQHASISGASLQLHWNAVVAAEVDVNDSKGMPYDGKSLKVLLTDENYDLITMQQVSVLSGNFDSFNPYAQNLYNFIKKLQPNAEIILHQTWAYRNDADNFTMIDDSRKAKDQKEMYKYSRAAYRKMAKQLNARLIPSGAAFWKICSNPKWAYNKETDFDFKNPEYPKLPKQYNSLNVGYYWNDNKEFVFDARHANNAGCYLGSLVWYSFLFDESPINLLFHPSDLSTEFASQLKRTAWKTVKKAKGFNKKYDKRESIR